MYLRRLSLAASLALYTLTCTASGTSSLLPNFYPSVGKYDLTVGYGTSESKSEKVGEYSLKTVANFLSGQLNYGLTERVIIGVGLGRSFDARYKEHPNPSQAARLVTGTLNPSFLFRYRIDDSQAVPSFVGFSITPKTSNSGVRSSPTALSFGLNSGKLLTNDAYWSYGAGLDWQDKINSDNASTLTLGLGTGLSKAFSGRITGSANISVRQTESKRYPHGDSKVTSAPAYLMSLALGYSIDSTAEWVLSFDRNTTKTTFTGLQTNIVCNPNCVSSSNPVKEDFKSHSNSINIRLVKRF